MLNNYGAVLQSYALQSYLKQYDNLDIYNIDFRTEEHIRSDKIFQKKTGRLIVYFVMQLFNILRYPQLKRRKKRTKVFKLQHFTLTKRYSTVKSIVSTPPLMDVYVSGSDQIFNPSGAVYKDVYFLNFQKGNARKVAYGASFGVDSVSKEYADSIAPCLNDFDALSCREQSGCDIIKNICGRESQHVIDPTLLLEKEDWEKIMVRPKCKGKYIFIYDLNGGQNLIRIAKEIADKINCKIICLTSCVYRFYHVDKQLYDAGPAEFVGWIHDAEYVITDSFHGTVFSIIFNKPFYTYIALLRTSSRIFELLNKTNCSERIINQENIDVFNYSIEQCNIDRTVLQKQIELSRKYIHDNIIIAYK